MFRRKRDVEDGQDSVSDAVVEVTASYDTDVDEYDDKDSSQDRADVDAEDDLVDGDDEYDEEYEERPRDPLVSWMTLMSVLLVLVVVVATGSIVWFLLGMRGAPRTATERLIIASEAAVSADPTVENYVGLGYAYLGAGRFREALTTTSRGRRVKDGAVFDLLEADILRAQGSHAKAVKLYERAVKRDDAEVEEKVADLKDRGIFAPVSRRTRVSIMIGMGDSLNAMGRTEDALKAFEKAVKDDSTNSFALVRIGDLNAELGNVEEAKSAYKEALRFIPDYKPALDGLSSLDDGPKE